MNKEEKFLGIRYSKSNDNRISKMTYRLIAGAILLIIIILALYCFTRTVTAQRETDRAKIVTSVEIKKGDTIWSIAQLYITDEYNSVNEYVDEIKLSNGLSNDLIHAGNYIVVPYYTDMNWSL